MHEDDHQINSSKHRYVVMFHPLLIGGARLRLMNMKKNKFCLLSAVGLWVVGCWLPWFLVNKAGLGRRPGIDQETVRRGILLRRQYYNFSSRRQSNFSFSEASSNFREANSLSCLCRRHNGQKKGSKDPFIACNNFFSHLHSHDESGITTTFTVNGVMTAIQSRLFTCRTGVLLPLCHSSIRRKIMLNHDSTYTN